MSCYTLLSGFRLPPTYGYTTYINQHISWGLMSVGIGRLNPAFGSARSASSAHQKWPTRRLAFHAQASSQQAGLLNHLRPYTQVGWPICTDRCGPPPEFPLASPCPGIVHHLSGTIAHALAPPAWRAPAFTFIVPWGLEDTFLLTRTLDSLVCVSRWAGWVADLATDLEHSLPGATSHLRPRPFLAKPEPAAAHRLGRRASDGPNRDD